MTEVGGMTYEMAETFRKAIFELVCNKTNWKLPINAELKVDSPELRDAITKSVIHYTGSIPTFERREGTCTLVVKAAGYYATIGA